MTNNRPRYVVHASKRSDYPFGVWDMRHRTEVTSYRTFQVAKDAADDMNAEHESDIAYILSLLDRTDGW